MPEFKNFAIKLVGVLIFTPLAGWLLLRFVEMSEKSWKSEKAMDDLIWPIFYSSWDRRLVSVAIII